jgi:hypothetical protein
MERDRVTNSCLGCTERRVGCHSACERYKAYREDMDNLIAARKRGEEDDSYFYIKSCKLKHAGAMYKRRQERR